MTWQCVICVLLGVTRASEAITIVKGHLVCGSHAAHALIYDLETAATIAAEDLERRPVWLTWERSS